MARAAWKLPPAEAAAALPAGPALRLATMLEQIADVCWWRGLAPADATALRTVLADTAATAADASVPMARSLLSALRAAALAATADAATTLPATSDAATTEPADAIGGADGVANAVVVERRKSSGAVSAGALLAARPKPPGRKSSSGSEHAVGGGSGAPAAAGDDVAATPPPTPSCDERV